MYYKTILKTSKERLLEIFQNRFLQITIIGLCILPLIYGALYLWAFWNPYGNISELPTAVVNLDNGFEKDGEVTNLGNDLVLNMSKNHVLDWDFVSLDEANKGLEDKKYYVAIIIPQDFSSQIYSVDTSDPQNTYLEYRARQSTNYIGAQIINKVVGETVNKVQNEVEKKYYESIFEGIADTGTNLEKASTSAQEIADGLNKAEEGSSAITSNLESAYTGANTLSSGLLEIKNGSTALSDNLNTYSQGVSQLNSKADDLVTGAKSLEDGAVKIDQGLHKVSSGVDELIENSEDIGTNLATANTVLNSSKTDAEKIATSKYIIGQILAQMNSDSTKRKVSKLEDGLDDLGHGQDTLVEGANELLISVEEKLKPAINTLDENALKLANGSSELNQGIEKAQIGANKLSNGLLKLKNGSASLSEGIKQAGEGNELLSEKLAEGASIAKEKSDPTSVDKMMPILTESVTLHDSSIATVENYGTAFAPYFLSLALWVGSLATFLTLKHPKENKKLEITSTLSRYLNLSLLSIAQVLILDFVLCNFVGLKVINVWAFCVFSILISWAFLAILLFVNIVFKEASSFVGILLLMLQLTGSAGTYPIETVPVFFQQINPILPMTHSISGLREIISGGNWSVVWSEVCVLLLFMVLSIIFTLIYIKSGEIRSLASKYIKFKNPK